MNDFAAQVEIDKYKRIPYKTWRELRTLSDANKVLVIGLFTNSKINEKARYFHKLIEVRFCMPADKKKLALLTLDDENSFAQFLNMNFFGQKIDGCVWTAENQDEDDMTITSAINEVCRVNGDSYFLNTDTGSLTYHTKDGGCFDLNNVYSTNTTTPITNTATTVTYGGAYTYTNYDPITDLKNRVEKLENKEKENNMKTNDMFNFDFGPMSGSYVRMSMYGYAIPNNTNTYVAYDPEHRRLMDVQILNFNCDGMFYKIPKPLSKVREGDVVFHNGVPMFISSVEENDRFVAIDPKEGTEKLILPSHSPFGFDYVTCLVSVMDGFDMPADEDNPFGNMLPFILMSNGQVSDQTFPLMMMMNGKIDFDNPMMLAMLFGNNGFKMDNPFMAMAMMKMFNK